jgi:hypothetical protein
VGLNEQRVKDEIEEIWSHGCHQASNKGVHKRRKSKTCKAVSLSLHVKNFTSYSPKKHKMTKPVTGLSKNPFGAEKV